MINQLKKEKLMALKAGDVTKSNILGVVIGQTQQLDNPSEDKIHSIIRKIIKSNEETMQSTNEKESLEKENEILNEYLPKLWTKEQIKSFIINNKIDLSSAKNDGQAMGMVMKQLKIKGAPVDATTVKEVIASIKNV